MTAIDTTPETIKQIYAHYESKPQWRRPHLGANLTGADLDFSCLPLWCGSFGVKVDKKIAVQLMYHACALDCDDPEYQEARIKVLDFANQMHRTDVKRLE